MGSIPDIPYGFLSTTRSKTWALLSVAQKTNTKKRFVILKRSIYVQEAISLVTSIFPKTNFQIYI